MKVKVKTIENRIAEIDVDVSETIGELKIKIAAALPDKPAANQKLIYRGKILADESVTIASVDLKEENFVIVMTQNKSTAAPVAIPAVVAPPVTPAAKSSAVTSTPAAPSRPEGVATAAPTAAPPSLVESGAALASNTTAAPAVSTDAAPGTPQVTRTFPDADVESLTALGFPRDIVETALRTTNGNVEAAGSFLLNMGDMPVDFEGEHSHDAHMDGENDDDEDGEEIDPAILQGLLGAQSGEYMFAEDHPLAPLERHPQFTELRMAVLTNPQLLPRVMGLITQQMPELAEAMASNQADFIRLITGGAMAGAAAGQAAGQGEGAVGAGGRVQVSLTVAENEQVENLAAMCGVSKHAALEAFLLCDRNVDAAANYLFENADEYQ